MEEIGFISDHFYPISFLVLFLLLDERRPLLFLHLVPLKARLSANIHIGEIRISLLYVPPGCIHKEEGGQAPLGMIRIELFIDLPSTR